MTEYEFTLVIDGDLTQEEVARELFESGCDDATFGVLDGLGYGDFLREAASFADAVLRAVYQIESVRPLLVRRIEPDDIVTMAEIADRVDRTRESVRLLFEGKRGPGGFPAPLSHGPDRGRLWRWSDVAHSMKELEPEDKEAAHFVAAANAAFDLRYRTRQMNDDAAAKELLGLVTY
ncbi:MAG TPA: hypothetical protein VGG09_10220 [Acidimicrobiales bacterium]|jgi:hypothetical protein